VKAPNQPIATFGEMPIRISPQAKVLPANTLRFYIHFPRPGEAHFDRHQLWLLNEEEQVVQDPFLVLSQELWSLDGRRLTVLMEPRRIKRGFGADPSHDPALVIGKAYSLVFTALGQTVSHTFRVSDPVLKAINETAWRLVSPTVGSLDPAVVHFDRVMDAALCEDEIGILTPSREVVQTHVSLASDGTAAQLIPRHRWSTGEHRLVVSERLEDVCGNRLGEALDHDLSAGGRPRAGLINFTPRSANAPSSVEAVNLPSGSKMPPVQFVSTSRPRPISTVSPADSSSSAERGTQNRLRTTKAPQSRFGT
jgi:hypothetical protein